MDERVYARYMSNLSYFIDKLEEKKTSKYHLPIALSYLKLEKYEEAVAVCNTALELFPSHCPTKTLLAEGNIYLGELDLAKEILFEVISEDEDNYKALKLLAFTMRQLNNNDGAIKYYKAAYFLAPEDEELLESLNDLGEGIDLDQILATKNKNPKKETHNVEGATSFSDISQSIKNAELMIEDLAKDIEGNETQFDEDYIDKFIDTSLTQLEEASKKTTSKKQPVEELPSTSLYVESEQEIRENLTINLTTPKNATDRIDMQQINAYEEKLIDNAATDELNDLLGTNIDDEANDTETNNINTENISSEITDFDITDRDSLDENIIDEKLITEDELSALLSVVDTTSFDDDQQDNNNTDNSNHHMQNKKPSPESELASLLEAVDDTTSMKDNSDILGLADDLEEITRSREPLQLDDDLFLDNRTGNILVNLYDIQNDNQTEDYTNFRSDIGDQDNYRDNNNDDDENQFLSSNEDHSNQPLSIDLGEESPFHQEDIFSEILSSVNTDIDTFGADKDKIDASTDKIEDGFTSTTLLDTTDNSDEEFENDDELNALNNIQKFKYDIDQSENEDLFNIDNIISQEELDTTIPDEITHINDDESIADIKESSINEQYDIADIDDDTINSQDDAINTNTEFDITDADINDDTFNSQNDTINTNTEFDITDADINDDTLNSQDDAINTNTEFDITDADINDDTFNSQDDAINTNTEFDITDADINDDTFNSQNDSINHRYDIGTSLGMEEAINPESDQVDLTNNQTNIIDTPISPEISLSNSKKIKNQKMIDKLEKRLEEIQKNK